MDKQVIEIVGELKARIAERYSISEMRVFGSTAQHRRSPESDIDVFIRIGKVSREIEEELFDLAYELELKYDCLIDLIVFGDQDLQGPYAQSPAYRNILREGIPV